MMAETHEYAFDVKLFTLVRVKASSEAEARKKLEAHFACTDANFGAWPDGTPITGEACMDEPGFDELVEVDGEAV